MEKHARLAVAAEALTSSPSLIGDDSKVQAKRLKEVEAELANLARAIKAGVLTETTKAELESCEAERAQLIASMAEGDVSHSKVVTMLPQVAERFRHMVENVEKRASRGDARDNARARTALCQFLGEVRVKSEKMDGVRVPVALLQGNNRAILRVVGAGPSVVDNWW